MILNLMVNTVLKEISIHSLSTNYPSYCDLEVMSVESGNETLRVLPRAGVYRMGATSGKCPSCYRVLLYKTENIN